MLQRILLLFLLITAPCAYAVTLRDVTATVQNFLEQPGNTFADATAYAACAGMVNAYHSKPFTKGANKYLYAISSPINAYSVSLAIRGLPRYKFLACSLSFTADSMINQNRHRMANQAIAILAGYTGLLVKNFITRYFFKGASC